MGILRALRRRYLLRYRLIQASLWQKTLKTLPLLQGLTAQERMQLRRLSTLFLDEKSIEPAQGLQLTQADRVFIAAQACLPILKLDIDWYSGWSALIVYPDVFITRHERADETGVVHLHERTLSGESWSHGPVIVSWADVQQARHSGANNVLIHELAHKLDGLNGVVNGFPPPHRGMHIETWSHSLNAAYEDLNARLLAGTEPPIDPYAAQSPGEYFAVCSEYFFAHPAQLRHYYPAVYEQLTLFYRQDPAARNTKIAERAPVHHERTPP